MFSYDEQLRCKGYTLHDGGSCPISPTSYPGVVLKDGSVHLMDTIQAQHHDWTQVHAWKLPIPVNTTFTGQKRELLQKELSRRAAQNT